MFKRKNTCQNVSFHILRIFCCFSLLIGQDSCNEKQNSDLSTKTSITVWMDSNDKEMEFQKKIAKIYEDRNPQIRINLKFLNFVDLKPKFIGQSKTRTEPDVVFIVNDWIGELVEKKLISEITGKYPEFIPRTLQSVLYKDKVFALPRNFEVITLFYNKKLVPIPPVNIKQLIDIGLKLKKQGIYGIMYDISDFYYHVPWLYGFGGRVFNPDGSLDTDSLKRPDSFRMIADLKDKYGILPKKVNQSAMINMFNSGQVGMIIAGPWSLGEIEKNNINYGMTLLPVLENGNRLQPFVGVKGYAVTKKSRYPDQAKKVIEFFTSKEIQKMAMRELDVLPCVQSIYETGKIPAKINGFYQQAKFGTAMPTYSGMKYIWRDYNWALNQIFFSKNQPDNSKVKGKATSLNSGNDNIDKKIQKILNIATSEANIKIQADNKLNKL